MKHIFDRLKPAYLKAQTMNTTTWRKNEQFDRKYLVGFIREAVKHSKHLRQELRISFYGFEHGRAVKQASSKKVKHVKRRRILRTHQPTTSLNTGSSDSTVQTGNRMADTRCKRDESDLPPCLNRSCSAMRGKYFIMNCPN